MAIVGPMYVATSPKETKRASLGCLLAGDLICAAGASFTVSPFVTAVDKGIIQFASGTSKTMGASIMASFTELAKSPHTFIRRPEFLMVWGVYCATYAAANTISSVCEYTETAPDLPKFVGVSCINLFACISKDVALTRMFGSGNPRAVPLLTTGLFAVRDVATIGASFNLPSRLSRWLQRSYDLSAGSANTVAQLVCPMGVQFLSTPVHLLGLSFYNRPAGSCGFSDRLAQDMTPKYRVAVFGRLCRIAPAFGFGGIGNKYLRDSYREMTAPAKETLMG